MIDQEAAYNFETVSITTSSTTITSTVGLMNAHRAVITCEGDQIRFRYDGTAPTSTVGHILNPGDKLILEGRSNILSFRAIRSSAATADATLAITTESI